MNRINIPAIIYTNLRIDLWFFAPCPRSTNTILNPFKEWYITGMNKRNSITTKIGF